MCGWCLKFLKLAGRKNRRGGKKKKNALGEGKCGFVRRSMFEPPGKTNRGSGKGWEKTEKAN